MNKKTTTLWSPMIAGLKAFWLCLPKLAFFTLPLLIVVHWILSPLFSWLMNTFVALSGQEVAFNKGILHFLFSLPGIFSLLCIAPLAITVTYFEFAFIFSLVRQPLSGEKPSIASLYSVA